MEGTRQMLKQVEVYFYIGGNKFSPEKGVFGTRGMTKRERNMS